jgi:ribosomal protein S14
MANISKWHALNKHEVFELSSGLCHKCKKEGVIQNGVIHHNSYKNINGKSVYEIDTLFLYNTGVIIWVCKVCHRFIHENEKIDNSTKLRGNCQVCGEKNGLLERGKLINKELFLCKNCFRNIRDGKSLPNKQLSLF